MAGELQLKLSTGLTLKALIWGNDRTKRWNGSALVDSSTIADAAWATGMVGMTEETTSDATGTGTYTGTFPTGITAAGEYAIEYYSGASPTPGQAACGLQAVRWGGSAAGPWRGGIPKNVALNDFEFLMIDSDDHLSPATGLTITAEISKDGGAFAACANSAAEISDGLYKISFTAAERNADVMTFKATATGGDQRTITFLSSE